MNWRQFSVALVQALAWPSVVLVVLLLYRRRVAQLLGDNLRRLTVGPVQAEWDRAVEEASATIEAAETLPKLQEGVAQRTHPQQLLSLARALVRLNPQSSIVYAWQAAREAFEAHLPMDDEELIELRTIMRMAKRARERGLIKFETMSVLEQLMRLSTIAYRVDERPKPTAEQAEDYLHLVEAFLGLLEAAPEGNGGSREPAQTGPRAPDQSTADVRKRPAPSPS
ncbi:hypothetical protein [Micromonospora globbae]|uniref:Uncharacterized protein n=1 Tax=Micromonospora globbae TaxID=1894969 RepID=A0A420EWZ6_9ACTN|nr:hypothetical protein [Micromonospora globbae]RKF25234.1 hypothetical protein D7I43_22535 [Micromonospora globbae]